MIVLGIVLLILGLLFAVHIFFVLGLILLILGLVLNFMPPSGGGTRRRVW